MKSNSLAKPAAILPLGDGSYHYNYNVQSVKVEGPDGKKETVYNYDVVHIWGTPSYAKLVKAVIREKYDESEEFNLINKYNAFALGLSENPEDKTEYEAYLAELQAIKVMVKADIPTDETK